MPFDPSISLYITVILFFIIALVYSSVGLGGGSSYTALLAILGYSALAIPIISLSLNLLVTSIGSYQFIRNKHARLKLILPFLVTSVPMAYLGGALQLPKEVFFWLLFISLCFVAARIYFWQETTISLNLNHKTRIIISLLTGSVLGLLSGIVGIGGGIYLIPLIIILGLGTGKEAAACGAIFTWINSLFGLVSRLQYNMVDLTEHLVIILAVVAGGLLGSYFGASRFSSKTLEKILGLIIVIAIMALGRKLLLV